MKNRLYIIFLLITIFLLNIFLYYYSEDYRGFLKSIKTTKSNVENNEEKNVEEEGNTKVIVISDKYDVSSSTDINKKDIQNQTEPNDEVLIQEEVKQETNTGTENNEESKVVFESDDNQDPEEVKVEYSSDQGELKLTKIEEEFLKLFGGYGLKEISLHPRLFDLTAEYPDPYFEYYSEYLTIYFFGNKPYSEIKDIFEVLTYELPFSLNEVNNFGDKSFYINLDKNFEDDTIRIVLLYKNRTFGLKLSKDIYENVKEKLTNLDK